jgi:anti-sigma factor ChrR (cupin superfamily)
MNSIDVNVNEIEWKDASGYPAGAKEKVLNVGSDMAPRSILLKLPPGWSMDLHYHRYTELHYVMEGEYESGEKVYSSGTFRIIPKEVEHGPFTTKTGAIILIVWCILREQ